MSDERSTISGIYGALAKLALGVAPIVAACAAWAAVVAVDVVVFGTRCVENSPVEWTQFALVSAVGALMALKAVQERRGRAAFVLASAFFFDMAIREMDGFLDIFLWHGSWSVLVAAVTAAAFAAVFAFRWQGTVTEGLYAIRSSRSFGLLATGLSVILAVSRIMGMKFLWKAIGCGAELSPAKRMVEECLELFGYCLVFIWACEMLRNRESR